MTRGRLRAASWVAGLAALATACVVTPSPSGAPSTAPTASTTAVESPWVLPSHRNFATARPFVPAPPVEQIADLPTVDANRTSATVTTAGVRLTLEVETTTLEAGTQAWVNGTLQNVGRRTLRWLPGGCGFPVYIRAELPFAWEYGQQQPTSFVFKQWLLDAPLPSIEHPIRLEIEEEPKPAGTPCTHELAPGDRLHGRHRLTAAILVPVYREASDYSFEAWLPPGGPVDIAASFGLWYRGDEDIDEVDHPTVEVRLPGEIVDGRDMRLISPGQAIDVALASLELREVLLRYPQVHLWDSTRLSLDAVKNRWIVEIAWPEDFGLGTRLSILVDGIVGKIVSVESAP